ncbi:MAG: hypothetical protein LBG67_00485 [Campylobacteraceae bacterium]|jgi:hypothetical protein|nr:hypothetical protein [Campylobacteraceae bacterium]
MEDIDELIEDALLLVEQNFYFLHVGEFFAKLIKKEDFSHKVEDVVIKRDNLPSYKLHSRFVLEVLQDVLNKPSDEIGLFEYFVEFNAIRGICMATVEALRLEGNFRDYMFEILGEKRFEDFYDILCFIRNVLSHNIHSEIKLSFKDYDGTKRRIFRMRRNPQINFSFYYAQDFPISPYTLYGFDCFVDFEAMDENTRFLDVIDPWKLLMICELCFNLVQAYRIKNG